METVQKETPQRVCGKSPQCHRRGGVNSDQHRTDRVGDRERQL
jgi:hypothetical protein